MEVSNTELYFTKTKGQNNLSQSNVKAIVQDSYGYMWFGTRNGLNRYDGYTFREYAVDDKELQCGNHNISALYEDDNRLLWVGTDKGVYIYNPEYESFSFVATPASDGVVMNDWVSTIEGDKDGNIWIIIPKQGVFRYSVADSTITSYYIPEKIMGSSDSPQCLCICNNGEVWIGSNGQGLFRYDKSRDGFDQFITDRNGNSLKGENIYALCEYGDGFAIGIHEKKLLKYDLKNNELSEFDTPQIHYQIIRALKCYDGKSLYVGTQDGLFIVNEQEGYIIQAKEDSSNPYSLSDNNVYSIYQDRNDGLWVGSLYGGIDYMAMKGYAFRKYFPTNRPHSLTSRRLSELCEDKYGRIWIASEDDGVNIYDPATNLFRKAHGGVSDKHINLAIFSDEKAVYCGLFKLGMEKFSLEDNSVKVLSGVSLNLLDEQSVCAIFRDSQGGYWLGNSWGVYYASEEGKPFERMSQLGYGFIYDIAEDTQQRVWIATMGSGVWLYDLKDKRVRKFSAHPGDDTALSSNSVSSITVDSRGDVWFATDRGGICRYNSESDNFTTFSKKNGLPDDVSYKILEDSLHNLWFGTNKGLVRFNPQNGSIRVFTKEDGLLSNQYNYKS
ncbi:MAG: hybrid sensor histidine kinase/response regulator, partial [Bacteroidales bacterium]|nr:hybrid sensor histidine kinase/response regulator [Bacteroidales bacterium]